MSESEIILHTATPVYFCEDWPLIASDLRAADGGVANTTLIEGRWHDVIGSGAPYRMFEPTDEPFKVEIRSTGKELVTGLSADVYTFETLKNGLVRAVWKCGLLSDSELKLAIVTGRATQDILVPMDTLNRYRWI